tara:strand:- start:1168 stop:1677 length:510 start_codon:yes stop_codon:yes gene_type:complete
MLGLGADISHAVAPSGLVPLVVDASLFVAENNDESVAIVLTYSDSATINATTDGTTGTSQFDRLNGTLKLTVTNVTADPDIVGSKTFNLFRASSVSDASAYVSTGESMSSITEAFFDLTGSNFLDSGGSAANLDASGAGEIYSFSAVLSIDGFEDSNASVRTNISIDAA